MKNGSTKLAMSFFGLLVFSSPLLAQFDEPPHRLIECEVVIAISDAPLEAEEVDPTQLDGRIDQLASEGKIVSRSQIRLVAIENHEVMMQIGDQVSVPAGRTFGGRRPPQGTTSSGRPVPTFPATTSYSTLQTGTMIKVLPRVADDGSVLVTIAVEQSRLRPTWTQSSVDFRQPTDTPLDGLQDTRDMQLPGVTTLSVQSETQVRDGKTVILGSFVSEQADGFREAIVLLTAHLMEP